MPLTDEQLTELDDLNRLKNLSEKIAEAEENFVKQAMTIDYAWLMDRVETTQGRPAHFLHDEIKKQFERLTNGDGIPGGGTTEPTGGGVGGGGASG